MQFLTETKLHMFPFITAVEINVRKNAHLRFTHTRTIQHTNKLNDTRIDLQAPRKHMLTMYHVRLGQTVEKVLLYKV